MPKKILVIGGAGYIGSHTCLALHEAGYLPVVVDDLSSGHREFVQWGPLYEVDFGSPEGLETIRSLLSAGDIQAVVHFAALIEVSESVKDPLGFYVNNVAKTILLLEEMRKAGVRNIVFSSTCATYGAVVSESLISEETPQAPINPYGRTKAMVENILRDAQAVGDINPFILRYFNAAGADDKGRVGEWHPKESHLIPLAIRAARDQSAPLTVFRSPAETPDGTCIRDYVHVMDLARAHLLAVEKLLEGADGTSVNIGTGAGTSVMEIIETISRIGGQPVPHLVSAPRPGDAPNLVADNSKARDVLGFRPERTIDDIIASAWRWHVTIRPETV